MASPDWVTISSLATAGGTLVLAVATFASVRSANRAARTAEHAFEVGQRPLIFPSRLEDGTQKIRWGDDHWAALQGGRATFEEVDGSIYMAMSVRNVGGGIAVLHAWHILEAGTAGASAMTQPSLDQFRPQMRDLYVPQGDVAFWQAAVRDPADPDRAELERALGSGAGLMVDVLYSDHEGEQRTISRFTVVRRTEDESGSWICSVVRHWNLDRPDPRDH
jgi:hypothetical protein